jgi:cytochrome P450 family 628
MEFRVHLLAGIVGMLSEALVFSKGEWDIRSPTLLKIATVVQIPLAGLLIVLGSSIFESIWNSMLLDFSYLSGLFSAMVVYRLFLHPLKNFPGPLGARATAFWVIKEQVPAFKFYTKLKKIHEEYGDFVRIREFYSLRIEA